eukprot:scaffold22599_cov139-Cylindrotheca_fusiformis.AAC.28
MPVLFLADRQFSSAKVVSYTISALNSLFPMLANALTGVEQHASEGYVQTSLFFKVALFRWVNTAFVLTMITPFTATLADDEHDGIIYKVFLLFWSEIVVTTILQLADVSGHVNRHIFAPRARTQDAMNLQFQGAVWSLAERLMRTWQRAPHYGTRVAHASRDYFFPLIVVAMVVMGTVYWSGFPYDNVCSIDDNSDHYKYCYEDFQNASPAHEWMTGDQRIIEKAFAVASYLWPLHQCLQGTSWPHQLRKGKIRITHIRTTTFPMMLMNFYKIHHSVEKDSPASSAINYNGGMVAEVNIGSWHGYLGTLYLKGCYCSRNRKNRRNPLLRGGRIGGADSPASLSQCSTQTKLKNGACGFLLDAESRSAFGAFLLLNATLSLPHHSKDIISLTSGCSKNTKTAYESSIVSSTSPDLKLHTCRGAVYLEGAHDYHTLNRLEYKTMAQNPGQDDSSGRKPITVSSTSSMETLHNDAGNYVGSSNNLSADPSLIRSIPNANHSVGTSNYAKAMPSSISLVGNRLRSPSTGVVIPSVSSPNAVPEFLYQLTKMLTDNNRDIIEWSNGELEHSGRNTTFFNQS